MMIFCKKPADVPEFLRTARDKGASDRASACMAVDGLNALPPDKALGVIKAFVQDRIDLPPAALERLGNEIARYGHLKGRD